MKKTTDPQILIVEDRRIIAEDLRELLEKLDYDVLGVVSSGEEAIKLVTNTQPDLILMDIKLEGDLDGIETASQIHENFNIPVIYLTAFSDEDILMRAKITEPFGYILKPFKDIEVHATIQMALYKHEIEEKLRDELQVNKEKYRELFENAIDAICILDTDSNYVDANKKAIELFGYPKDELLGMSVFDMLPEEQTPESQAEFEKLKQRGAYERFRGKTITKSEQIIDIEVSSSAIYENGEFVGSQDIIRDISDQIRDEEKIKEQSEELTATNEELTAMNQELLATQDELSSLNKELEMKVEGRTSELNARVKELEKWYSLTRGREGKMIELKREINSLLKEMGREKKYSW